MVVMKCLKPLQKTLAFALGLVLVVGLQQAQAVPVALDEVIVNGGFGSNASPSLAGWTPAGTALARPSTNAANTNGGNAGFNSFFTNAAFALLGNSTGNIGNNPIAGTSSISQTFTLPTVLDGSSIRDYDLTT